MLLKGSVKDSLTAWIVCMAAALSFFYCFVQMTQLNAIGPLLSANLHINATKLSILTAMYFWANVIFAIPSGYIIDKYSKKNLLIITLIITSMCLTTISITSNLFVIAACYFVIGVCGVIAFITPLSLVADWFKPNKIALVSGILIAIGTTGCVASHTPLIWLTEIVNWRFAVQCNAVFGIIILCITFLFVKNNHCSNEKNSTLSTSCIKTFIKEIIAVIKNSQNWVFSLYASFLSIPTFIFGAAFGIHYLTHALHMTEYQAAHCNTMLFIGSIIGSPFFGWLANKIEKRKFPMYMGAIATLLLVLILMTLYHPAIIFVDIIFFLLGFCISAQVIVYPAIIENNGENHSAIAISLCSTVVMAGGAIFIPLFGLLLDLHVLLNTSKAILAYTISDFKFALWLLPASIILSIIFAVSSQESNAAAKESVLEMSSST
ncbi:MAG: MFS transporter [Gammaproteobacteria bacterium]